MVNPPLFPMCDSHAFPTHMCSATLALYGGSLVPYYLEEEQAWGLNTEELKAALAEARRKGMCVRALVVSMPANADA
eukprot:1157817-Pelagomonas_calceolata.AAC.3